MKKTISMILCLLIALMALAGCAGSGETSVESAGAQSAEQGSLSESVSEALDMLAYQLSRDGDSTDPPEEVMASQRYTIGVALPHLANPHFIAEAYGFISEGEKLGVEVIVNEAGGYTNLSTQIQQFEDYMANKVDALIIVAVDAEGTVGIVNQANAIGIPVINVNVMTASQDVVTKIRSDDTTIGEMQAEFVGEQLGGQGKILMLCGPAGSSWAMDRSAGYENYMQENYPDIEIVDKRFLDSEPTAGLSEMEDALQVYPDLAAVFAGSDNIGLGAAQAIKAAGLDGRAIITTTDTQDACLEYVREGVITATVCQSSAIMGQWGTRAAVAVLEGKAPELVKRYWTPLNLITQENVDTFEFEGISRPPEGWTVGGTDVGIQDTQKEDDGLKAAVLHEPGRLLIEEAPVPKIGEGEVLVQVKATAICGTDVSIYKGKIIPASYPVIQRHESAGIIAEVGKGVRRVKAGDHVIINPAIYCGECDCCLHGLSNLCLNGGLLGRDMPGTFAEYVAVPENSLTLLPKEVSFDDASSLQSLATALRSWDRMAVAPGNTVAVIGLGTPGLLHTRMAVLSGATVLAVTRSKWKLDIAEAYGAQPVNPVMSNPVQSVMERTGGLGADLVIEAAGTSATMAQAIEMARPGGTVMLFGTVNSVDDFNAYSVYYKELTLLGSRAMNRNGYEKAVALYSAGKFDLSPLVTHHFTLEDTAKMFDMVYDGSQKSLRVVCTFE